MKKKCPLLVATFAAIDGSGGAGVLADCRALAAAEAVPLAITTAITAQNLDGVQACWALSAQRVKAQFSAYPAANIAAVKIGVVGQAAAAIAACIRQCAPTIPVVWDPVLAPTTGKAFVTSSAIASVRRHLLPVASMITPNRRELLQLANAKRTTSAIAQLFAAGCRQLLVTDIDGSGERVRHVLLTAEAQKTPIWEISIRRQSGVYHGSGCLFSATLAVHLARGESSATAAAAAQKTVQQAIRQAVAVPSLGRQKLLIN